ncbi:cytidine and deoxycytidylate deaminase zinc-binding domain-containing protein [Magnaporthiopsis poae ATCC 64411]|uniref:Cytidine and deoxycytidylate deaminase zinc-binding domain-containing protein n=1 Tax=Magnaporthiopsis poae (strain ATCC 64411 / 73-15) TaxID=644358 RepID=A0A0C4EEC7_MAGP6|nr:cytidine and deoxycytidylate deaminase zinc-binding domain-containing protein [Magnaporthiopsis poae ATCC 64411]
MSQGPPRDHRALMEQALGQARLSPPKPSNYRVGAVLVDASTGSVLATGFSLELPGNTHAEQCCFIKLAQQHGVAEEALVDALQQQQPTPRLALYTTMEPCSERLSGNLPCVQRILRLRGLIAEVYVGVVEPKKFVANNTGRQTLEDAGIRVIHVGGYEEDILGVATAGHAPAEAPVAGGSG